MLCVIECALSHSDTFWILVGPAPGGHKSARASIFTDAALPSASDTGENRADAANTRFDHRFLEAARCKSLWIKKVTEDRIAHKNTLNTKAADTGKNSKRVTE